MTIRLIKHEAMPDTGSFEVRFADGRRSVYFYVDGLSVASVAAGADDPRGSPQLGDDVRANYARDNRRVAVG
ncbi:hypothetical protein [Bradyrhizobium sp. CCBAU 51627]|uniref:hypothetical protein n=1 Tax=Bradyrhizobium sp. CCBAU 51627 TaxID=1325088 RepID=UPI00230579A2|nr:hypothetical protein [Bradyrhizobium sp. CCBAU 51627]